MPNAVLCDQFKRIKRGPVLELIYRATHPEGLWCNRWNDDERDVRRAMPDGVKTPERIVSAYMFKLIKSGYVTGCACGCRGDFELTIKGIRYAVQYIIKCGRELPDEADCLPNDVE